MDKNSAHVLVIDDDQDMLDMIQTALKIEGYSVSVADNGKTGLEKVNLEFPELILLDIRMPGLDGYQVLKQIRKISNIPVIMLTAIQEPHSVSESLDLGADDYITKPFSIQELTAHIRAKLRRIHPVRRTQEGDSQRQDATGIFE
jgi:DNA-binding response OmpR family regulator